MFFLLCCQSLFNPVLAQEEWVNYVSMKGDKALSVSLDLSFELNRPNYKNLVIVGSRFNPCMKNGFPDEKSLPDLYAYSDSIAMTIHRNGPHRLVGYLTYQCLAFDVFYVRDTIGLRDMLTNTIKENYGKVRSYIDIKRDRNWMYYWNFLYPTSFSSEFLIDQQYLNDLALQGDDLLGRRKVNHWIYFKKLKDRNKMAGKLEKLGFSLDSIAYRREKPLPFQLTISRLDYIVPDSIYELTTYLRKLSSSMEAEYDGWSTVLKTETEPDP